LDPESKKVLRDILIHTAAQSQQLQPLDRTQQWTALTLNGAPHSYPHLRTDGGASTSTSMPSNPTALNYTTSNPTSSQGMPSTDEEFDTDKECEAMINRLR
jgi:hypothetical protein